MTHLVGVPTLALSQRLTKTAWAGIPLSLLGSRASGSALCLQQFGYNFPPTGDYGPV